MPIAASELGASPGAALGLELTIASPPPLLRQVRLVHLWCKCEEGRVRNAGKHSTSEDVTSSSSTGKWSENPLGLGLQRAFCDELLAKLVAAVVHKCFQARLQLKVKEDTVIGSKFGFGKGKAYKQIDDEKEISNKNISTKTTALSKHVVYHSCIFWYSFCRS